MASRKQLASRVGARSSLLSHAFPQFYACYLLKSIQTPQSKATYIGSTPSPPRRIRQHNGEITQGAWKTKNKRPWVMQMIVHGFPSRLAALQFEWAWQHPHLSRHLRDANGKALLAGRSKYLKANIQTVRLMISNHPYSTWPLHIKLFTEEAVKGWRDATKDTDLLPLPRGFTCSIELEGVDGKSGKVGSGRQGPITVKDEQFTSAYLAKNTALLASNQPLNCSICAERISEYTSDPLSTALCPASSCTAISHLSCLSKHFTSSQDTVQSLLPRGGNCTSCHSYTLWGDIVRGCYRRKTGGTICEPEEDDIPEDVDGELYMSDVELEENVVSSPRLSSSVSPKKRKAVTTTRKPPKRKAIATAAGDSSSEGELFDKNVSEMDGLPETPRKRGRPRKAPPTGVTLELPTVSQKPVLLPKPHVTRKIGTSAVRRIPKISKTMSKHYSTATGHAALSSSGESFDFDGISEDSEDNLLPSAPSTSRHAPKSLSTLHADKGAFLHSTLSPAKGHTLIEALPPLSHRADAYDTDVEDPMLDESSLSRAMSVLSVSSSAAPNAGPLRYFEISD
ncbi:Structure-specific endonuclease subunit SLX1 [Hypsizygus marmoreus]|uniref:Structure-specific endonuclease subunit SLX1 n=1 Tax=Hypsizygus marmoreus TaxID=39966 RepID=A0A369JUH0_HYPMA|nr:Structure-specific endonuclease subunit SLX1 [Hypsizygus marmoreus]